MFDTPLLQENQKWHSNVITFAPAIPLLDCGTAYFLFVAPIIGA